VIDEGRRIVRLDPQDAISPRRPEFHWSRGDVADAAAMERVAEWMADAVLASVSEAPLFGRGAEPVPDRTAPGAGRSRRRDVFRRVAEYVYQRETREFGDMGPLLGRALAKKGG